jgi:hypothetical protein
MTAVTDPDTDLVYSGVTLAFGTAGHRTTIERALETIAVRCDGRPFGGEGRLIGSIGFHLADEMSAVTVREMLLDVLAARPEIPVLLGALVRGSVRVEMVTRPDDTRAASRADRALTALIVEIARSLPLVACDDVGAVYDLDELRILTARGAGRFESSAFLVESARRAEELAADDVVPPLPPSEPVTMLVPLVGTRVPALTWLDVIGRPHTGIVAPALDACDVVLLESFGIPYARRFDELELGPDATVDDRARDELDLHVASPLDAANVAEVVESVALAWAVAAAERDMGDAPALTAIASPALGEEGVTPIARCTFNDAVCNVTLIRLPLPETPAGIALRSRADVAPLLDGPVRSIVALELIAEGRVDAVAMRRADAFSIAIAAEFAQRWGTVATDLGGGTYTPAAIARLAERRATRDGSWIARVAAAVSTQPE